MIHYKSVLEWLKHFSSKGTHSANVIKFGFYSSIRHLLNISSSAFLYFSYSPACLPSSLTPFDKGGHFCDANISRSGIVTSLISIYVIIIVEHHSQYCMFHILGHNVTLLYQLHLSSFIHFHSLI